MKNKISLVGSGIKTFSHISKEAEAHIVKADLVLYLVNEPVLEEWIYKNSNSSENLKEIYFGSEKRDISYEKIKNAIISHAEKNNFVCVVFYGHPTVFAKPGLNAIKELEAKGFETKILPAISAEDCLFADLKIDPSDVGCYSVEATDLIIHQRIIDTSSHLVIWQAGILGMLGHEEKSNYIHLLIEYLVGFYSKYDPVFIYEASLYPSIEFKLEKVMLGELKKINLSKISMLYLPPNLKKKPNLNILNKLEFL